jgi:hypothetical protein
MQFILCCGGGSGGGGGCGGGGDCVRLLSWLRLCLSARVPSCVVVQRRSSLRLVFNDTSGRLVVKVIAKDSLEHCFVQRMLGQQPWPASSRRSGCVRLWETLRLVPLAFDGVVDVDCDEHRGGMAAVVMERLVPLAALSLATTDIRVLLRVVYQVAEVLCDVTVAIACPCLLALVSAVHRAMQLVRR